MGGIVLGGDSVLEDSRLGFGWGGVKSDVWGMV